MKASAAKAIPLLIAGCALVCTALAVCLPVYLQMVTDGKLARMRLEGIELAKHVRRKGGYELSHRLMAYSNSTEVLLQLTKDYDIELYNWIAHEARGGRRKITDLTASNNIWSIVQNLPTNAPRQSIVLATRNVNVASLRTRISREEMFKRVVMTGDGEVGLLREYAIVIRKDGQSFVLKTSRRAGTGCSGKPTVEYPRYGYIYDEPFDVFGDDTNRQQLIYLTPVGEVKTND